MLEGVVWRCAELALSGKNIAVTANRAEIRHFVDHCGRAFL